MRRQAVGALDSFWSKYYDLHGRPLSSLNQTGASTGGAGTDEKSSAMFSSVVDDFVICLGELCRVEGGHKLFEQHAGSPWDKVDQLMLEMCSLLMGDSEGGHEPKWQIQQLLKKAPAEHQAQMAEGGGGRQDIGCEGGSQVLLCLGKNDHQWVFDGPQDFLFVFGLWCLVRLLGLCKIEPRPELWGKYAAVLNRLQWMLPRIKEQNSCGSEACDQKQAIQQMLNDIEASIHGKRGPKGTAAGDVAFPKVCEDCVLMIEVSWIPSSHCHLIVLCAVCDIMNVARCTAKWFKQRSYTSLKVASSPYYVFLTHSCRVKRLLCQ